jgi:hypothetical protein
MFSHPITSIDLTETVTPPYSAEYDFSLTGPESPDFEVKGTLSVSDIYSPSPELAISLPDYCTDANLLTVELLTGSANESYHSYEDGHFCDFTDPAVESCCLETSREAQDACLIAKGTGTRFCDVTDPAVEPCCQEVTYDAQDQCLYDKGIYRRRLGAADVDHLSKQIAMHTLKKLHSVHHTAKSLFKEYTAEKKRLMRRAFVEYSVAGVLAVLVFAAGAWRYGNIRKWYAAAPTDEEPLVEEGLIPVTE